MSLPNFLYAGTSRAASTFLHSVFRQHPDIYVPLRSKEQNFFDLNFCLGVPYYELTAFADVTNEKAIGEVTPSYMDSREAPERIARTLGRDVKLIFCLRNPVARAYSYYLMYVSWLWENLTFTEAIKKEAERIASPDFGTGHRYLATGLYGEQVERFLEYFPLENMFFMIFETDFLINKKKTIQNLFSFLEVDDYPVRLDYVSNKNVFPSIQQMEKDTKIHYVDQKQKKKYVFEAPKGSIVITNLRGGRYAPTPVRIIKNPSSQLLDYVKKLHVHKPAEKIDFQTQNTLIHDYFLRDIQKLESLIHRDLSFWYKKND